MILRILGVDYGDSKIGIAISDLLGWTAQGLETIRVKEGVPDPIKRIKELVQEYDVKNIVVGFPKNMDGTIGIRGEKTIEFTNLLKEEIENIDVKLWDERLTTVSAKKAMHEMGMKTSKKKKVEDQMAAVFILQGYLDITSK